MKNTLKEKLLEVLPALRVHSWGGFGSQLFTAYVVLRIQKQYPGRRIKIVIHTSGVTRRESEFNFQVLGVNLLQKEDYKIKTTLYEKGNDSSPLHVAMIQNAKSVLYFILQFLRLVQSADSDSSYNLIRFWTLALRGHYTRLTLDKSLVEHLYQTLIPFFSKDTQSQNLNSSIVIHYRLGDLLDLKMKQPIKPERIEALLKLYQLSEQKALLLTDSNHQEVVEYLNTSSTLLKNDILNLDPFATLELCLKSEVFVGTGAKLSLWVAIFRSFLLEKNSFLPTEISWARNNLRQITWY
jgi:hypothetical protein